MVTLLTDGGRLTAAKGDACPVLLPVMPVQLPGVGRGPGLHQTTDVTETFVRLLLCSRCLRHRASGQ